MFEFEGKSYVNRTKIYMGYQLLYHLDFNIAHAIRLMDPVMWGTYDADYIKAKKISKIIDYRLFVLIHLDNETKKSMVNMLKKDKYYIDSYPYSLTKKDLIFVVYKIPRPLHKAYDRFLEGNFSKMYTLYDLNRYQITEKVRGAYNNLYAVLTKNTEFKPVFQARISKEYGLEVEVDDNAELDSFFVPPTYEAFNVEHYGPLPKLD